MVTIRIMATMQALKKPKHVNKATNIVKGLIEGQNIQGTHSQYNQQQEFLLQARLQSPTQLDRQDQGDNIGEYIECSIGVDERHLVDTLGLAHKGDIPRRSDRFTSQGEKENTEETVYSDEDHDGVGHLPEALVGAESEVEKQDRGLDEPDAQSVDVFFCNVVL